MAALPDTPSHLQGNGRPTTEEQTLTELKVTGSIPAELDGRYVRNGANPLTGLSDHPFFGDGMVHGLTFDGEGGDDTALPTLDQLGDDFAFLRDGPSPDPVASTPPEIEAQP